MNQPYPGPTGRPRLTRRPDDKLVAGVCSGVAAWSGLDPTLVRVLAGVGAVFLFPLVPVAYLVAWVVMPSAARRV